MNDGDPASHHRRPGAVGRHHPVLGRDLDLVGVKAVGVGGDHGLGLDRLSGQGEAHAKGGHGEAAAAEAGDLASVFGVWL